MEQLTDTTERLRLAVGQARLIADLLLSKADLQDVARDNFAYVMQELTGRLERDLAGLERLLNQCRGCTTRNREVRR